MLPRNAWLSLLAFLFVSLASCTPIDFGKQELMLRHDAKQDALDLLIVYDAIQSSQEDAEVSRGFATRVSGGHREFMIFDWPMHFVLEELEHDMTEPTERELDPWRDWQHELVKNFTSLKVSDSGYCTDEATSQLGLYQSLHIGDAAHWIALFERALYIGIEDSLAKGKLEDGFELFDARTRELWIAMAKAKRSWLSLKDDVLTVDLPATGTCVANVLGAIMQDPAGNTDSLRFFAGLVSHISELRVADEHVLLRWKLAGPTFTFAPPRDHKYDSRLAQSLIESKALPEAPSTRADVIERFGRR